MKKRVIYNGNVKIVNKRKKTSFFIHFMLMFQIIKMSVMHTYQMKSRKSKEKETI